MIKLIFIIILLYTTSSLATMAQRELRQKHGIDANARSAQHLMNHKEMITEYIDRIKTQGVSLQDYLRGKEAGLTVEAIIAKQHPPEDKIATQPQTQGCHVIAQRCIAGPETRAFTLYNTSTKRHEGLSIHRPCWQYHYTYECGGYPSKNNCQALRAQGCEQMDSKVVKSVGGQAVIWEQHMRCPTGKGTLIKKPIEAEQAGIKIPGDQGGLKYAPNHDMSEAIANLAVLKEIQADLGLNAESQDKDQIIYQVFRGKQHACDVHTINFSNCCEKLSGWGVNMGMTQCTAEEKQLAQLKERGLCIKVGTFCAEREKITKVCLRKRTHYCCFPSKLSRLVHQQGRPQLGIGWGEAKQPECRGFLVDELSRLDFSRLDLRELYADIQARMKVKSESVISRNLSERMKHMTSGGRNDAAKR